MQNQSVLELDVFIQIFELYGGQFDPTSDIFLGKNRTKKVGFFEPELRVPLYGLQKLEKTSVFRYFLGEIENKKSGWNAPQLWTTKKITGEKFNLLCKNNIFKNFFTKIPKFSLLITKHQKYLFCVPSLNQIFWGVRSRKMIFWAR